jgi:hypothetical protein
VPDRDDVSFDGDDVSGPRTKAPRTESTPLGDKLRVMAVAYKSSQKDDWAAGLAQAADVVDEDAHLLQGRAFVDALDRMLHARLELFVEQIAADVVAAIHDTAPSSPPPAPHVVLARGDEVLDPSRRARASNARKPRRVHVSAEEFASMSAVPGVVVVGDIRPQKETAAVGVRRVLAAVVQHMPAGVDAAQLTLLTGYKKTTRDLYVRKAVASGWLQKHGGRILSTRAGERELGPNFKRLPTGDALRNHWLDRLPEGERRVLAYVASFYPHPCSSDQITRATSYKKTTRDLYVRKLKSRKLIEKVGKSHVQAAAMLFDTPEQKAASS